MLRFSTKYNEYVRSLISNKIGDLLDKKYFQKRIMTTIQKIAKEISSNEIIRQYLEVAAQLYLHIRMQLLRGMAWLYKDILIRCRL